MTAPNKMAKRAAAGTLALAVCLTGGVIGAGAASAAPGFKFDTRISGPDRTATSIAAAEYSFGDGSETVIIVERDAVVDGLTASYAAGLNKAPILYVDRQGVPDQVAAEIKKLGAKKAILVGGKAVLPESVKTQLESAGLSVTRQSGPDRYATAAAVALSGNKMPDKVLVASGETPADALAAGPLAYAKNYPLVLVRPDSVPDSSRDALDKLGSGERLAIGGTARISQSVFDSLGEIKRRLSGPNRQATAIEIAKVATGELGFNKDRVALVSDQDRAAVDALVASPVAGSNLAPLLFTNGSQLGGETTKYLQDHVDELTGPGYVFGGTTAVPQSVVDAATDAADGDGKPETGNEGINITPNDAQTLVIPTGADDVTDDRSYAVDGLDDTLKYNITLVDAKNVNIDASGKVTFKSSADSASKSGFSVDPGTVTTDITVVNGSPTGAPTANVSKATSKPVGGKLSFTIDGDQAESVYPVIYVEGGAGKDADNGGPSTRLETQATKAGDFAEGAEKYGLGGLTTYVPVEADAGQVGAGTPGTNIDSVNKVSNYIIAGGKTLFFDDNDQFRINGAPATLAKFAESLSTGDGLLTSTYAADADLQSTFDINDRTPSAVAGVDATEVDDTSVKVIWTATGSTTPSTYTIYRRSGTVESDKLTDYTQIATVPGNASPLEYIDKGLTASTGYTYAVTQTVDGDESALTTPVSGTTTDSVDTATTSAPGVTAAPQSIAAGVTVDNTFAGTVSATDEYTIAFNRALDDGTPETPGNDETLPNGAVIRIQDAGGESVDLVNGTNATFSTNSSGVTYNGKTQEANTVLTVVVTTTPPAPLVDRDGSTSNNNGSVDYPATIVAQSGITATVQGSSAPVAWNPATSSDNVLETGATAAADVGPLVQTAQFVDAAGTAGDFDGVADRIDVTYDEVPVLGANPTVTIGGVTLNNTNSTITVVGNAVRIVWLSANIPAVVGKEVTASTDISDSATPADSDQARGYPKKVTL